MRGEKIAMKNKKIIRNIVILCVIAIAAFGVYKLSVGKKKDISVRTSKATVKDLKSYLSTTGKVESANTKDYYTSQLKVTKIYVKVGDNVKKGDTLVSFDTSDLDSAIKQAQISYNNAGLQYNDLISKKGTIDNNIKQLDDTIKQLEGKTDNASAQALALAKLNRNQLIPISDTQIKQAQSAVDLAKIQLDSARNKVSTMGGSIVADFNGTVTALNLSEGSVGNPTIKALTLQDLSDLKIKISLNKNDSSKVAVNSKVVIHGPEGDVSGVVSFIDPAAKQDTSNPLAAGEVSLGGEIKPTEDIKGLKVEFDEDVDILLGEKSGALSVPAEALKSAKGNKYYVYVVNNGVVKETEVKVGLQTESDAEILLGLNAGDEVILNPNENITNGTKVTVSS